MPQLDKFTFIGQVFWLLVVFLSLYSFLLTFILPRLGRILKFRSYELNELKSEIDSNAVELLTVERKLEKTLRTLSMHSIECIDSVRSVFSSFQIQAVIEISNINAFSVLKQFCEQQLATFRIRYTVLTFSTDKLNNLNK